jgi:hypothetical protein
MLSKCSTTLAIPLVLAGLEPLGNPPASASQVAGTTEACHQGTANHFNLVISVSSRLEINL